MRRLPLSVLGLWVPVSLLLVSNPVLAQPPAETCGVGDSTTSGDMLPFNQTGTASTNNFTMTGTGCNELGTDNVTCMTPANGCTVTATCADDFIPPPAQGGPSPDGLQLSVSAFDGGCNTSPASCLDSNQGTGSGTITGLALTAGTTYCFVCERGIPGTTNLQVTATSGDCGALPVGLESFSAE